MNFGKIPLFNTRLACLIVMKKANCLNYNVFLFGQFVFPEGGRWGRSFKLSGLQILLAFTSK